MERSIMIQYTGTSSRSNYNDERTATIGRPSELLRRLGVESRPVLRYLLASVFLSLSLSLLSALPHLIIASTSCSFRCSSLILFALLSSSLLYPFPSESLPSSSSPPPPLLLLVLPYSRRSLRCIAPQQEQTSLRGRHGATESRWMDLSRSFLDPPELSRGPPRGFTWPEVRHQRNTCSMKPSYGRISRRDTRRRVVARPRTPTSSSLSRWGRRARSVGGWLASIRLRLYATVLSLIDRSDDRCVGPPVDGIAGDEE